MVVLLDLGNTRCKWALAQAGRLLESGALSRDARLGPALAVVLAALPRPEAVFAISVADQQAWHDIEQACTDTWGIAPRRIVTPAVGGGVRVAYDYPQSLGTDRWAAMVGAVARGWLPALIVDCGTAATLDVLDAAGVHRGGLICPGLDTMRRSLHAGTHGLPSVAAGALPLLATNTPDAIRAGTFHGLCRMVEGFHDTLSRESGEPLQAVLTGGDAGTLCEHLHDGFHLAPDLVLEGLAQYVAEPAGGSS